MDRFSAYDSFAAIYNNSWGEDYHGQIERVLSLCFYPFVPVRQRVLDLCCGAGHVTEMVAAHGYRVVGIDGSAEMLRYAQQRVPAGEFVCADARRFALALRADGAISTYDSLNHIMTTEELQQVFECVRAALTPGARFFFDMNADEAYLEPWTHMGSSPDRARHWIARGTYDPATRIAACEVEEMWREGIGDWKRQTFHLQQRCYNAEEVLHALAAAGFAERLARTAEEAGMNGPAGEGRVFYSGNA